MSLPFIVAVAVVAIIEIWLSSVWSPFYFGWGLPIFRTRLRQGDLGRLSSRWLTQQHLHSHLLPFRFSRLNPKTIAFREGLGLLHYTPILHGVIRAGRGRRGGAMIVGYLNWAPGLLVFGLLVADVWNLIHGQLGFPAGAAALFVAVVLYGFQVARLARVRRLIAENLDYAPAVTPQPLADEAGSNRPLVTQDTDSRLSAG